MKHHREKTIKMNIKLKKRILLKNIILVNVWTNDQLDKFLLLENMNLYP